MSPLLALRHEEDFDHWKADLIEAIMLRGYDEDVILRGCVLK
jgi:hypothetical protein